MGPHPMNPRLILSLGAEMPLPPTKDDFNISGAAKAAAVVVFTNCLRVNGEFPLLFSMIIYVDFQ
jgi:hypothetical protein